MSEPDTSAEPRAAEQAQRHARRPPADYDDEGRPAAARARDNRASESESQSESEGRR
jgi:hypothetical protein